MGLDLRVEDVQEFLEKVLMDRLCRKNVKPGTLKPWIKEFWFPFLGYEPIFHEFNIGWLFFS